MTTNSLASIKGPPQKLPVDMTETTISEPKCIHVGLRQMEVENVILALFDFDEQACNVDRYSSSFVSC